MDFQHKKEKVEELLEKDATGGLKWLEKDFKDLQFEKRTKNVTKKFKKCEIWEVFEGIKNLWKKMRIRW